MQDDLEPGQPVQNFVFGGIANPTQRPFLRGADRRYLEARQAELDRFEGQRQAYNTALQDWQANVYNPYVNRLNAFNAAAQQYNTDVYNPYKAQVDAYNAALEQYNREVYNPYVAQYGEYERAVNAYNAGDRTADYTGPAAPTLARTFDRTPPTEPRAFDMTAPTAPADFSMAAPVLPFKEEDVTAYQQSAGARARKDMDDRALAIEVVSNPNRFNFGSMSVANRFMAKGGPVEEDNSGQARKMMDAVKRVSAAGRGGDKLLAYLSPDSRAILKKMGGAGSINPKTGIMEFDNTDRYRQIQTDTGSFSRLSDGYNSAFVDGAKNALIENRTDLPKATNIINDLITGMANVFFGNDLVKAKNYAYSLFPELEDFLNTGRTNSFGTFKTNLYPTGININTATGTNTGGTNTGGTNTGGTNTGGTNTGGTNTGGTNTGTSAVPAGFTQFNGQLLDNPWILWTYENGPDALIAQMRNQPDAFKAKTQAFIDAANSLTPDSYKTLGGTGKKFGTTTGTNTGGTGETFDMSVIVYGPDGKMYSSPAAARAAGVFNYTTTPPATAQPTPGKFENPPPGFIRFGDNPGVLLDTDWVLWTYENGPDALIAQMRNASPEFAAKTNDFIAAANSFSPELYKLYGGKRTKYEAPKTPVKPVPIPGGTLQPSPLTPLPAGMLQPLPLAPLPGGSTGNTPVLTGGSSTAIPLYGGIQPLDMSAIFRGMPSSNWGSTYTAGGSGNLNQSAGSTSPTVSGGSGQSDNIPVQNIVTPGQYGRIGTASGLIGVGPIGTAGQYVSATNPNYYFGLNQPAATGMLPGVIAAPYNPLAQYQGPSPLAELAANPNLSPTVLGGAQNLGVMRDRLGNPIYSPALPRVGFAGGGLAQATAAQNVVNAADDDDEGGLLNLIPTGAQAMLAELPQTRVSTRSSPTGTNVKRTSKALLTDKMGQPRGMAMQLEELLASKPSGLEARESESARSQMEALALAYRLREKEALNTAKGLMKATFSRSTLEKPSLLKSKLTKKRFAIGGAVYRGPQRNRGVTDRGLARVSREELEDFKRLYGENKTLRDLLNADRSGRVPALRSELDPRARGVQGANIAPKPTAEDALMLAKYKDIVANPERDAVESMLGPEMALLGGPALARSLMAAFRNSQRPPERPSSRQERTVSRQEEALPGRELTLSRQELDALTPRILRGERTISDFSDGGEAKKDEGVGGQDGPSTSGLLRRLGSTVDEVPQLDAQGRLIDENAEARSESQRMLNRLKTAQRESYRRGKLPPGAQRVVTDVMSEDKPPLIRGKAIQTAGDVIGGLVSATPRDPTNPSEAYRLAQGFTGAYLPTAPVVKTGQAAGMAMSQPRATMSAARQSLEELGDISAAALAQPNRLKSQVGAVRPYGKGTVFSGVPGVRSGLDEYLSEGLSNWSTDKDKTEAINNFFKTKARRYMSSQFGTEKDPIFNAIREGRISNLALHGVPGLRKYAIDAAQGSFKVDKETGKQVMDAFGRPIFRPKDPQAFIDVTQGYDELVNVQPMSFKPGLVPRAYSESPEQRQEVVRIQEQMGQAFEAEGLDPRLVNMKPPISLTTTRDTGEPFYSGGYIPNIDSFIKNKLLGNPEKMKDVPENVTRALNNNELLYNVLVDQYIYGLRQRPNPLYNILNPKNIANYLLTLSPKEIDKIPFESAVVKAAEFNKELFENRFKGQRVHALVEAGKAPDSLFSEGVSAPLLQFDQNDRYPGYAWKRIEDINATVPEGAYVGHSVGGYVLGGPGYGPSHTKGFQDGRHKVYSLRNDRNRPVTTIQVIDQGTENSPYTVVKQIKGNGARTGNTAPANYDAEVVDFLSQVIKPDAILESDEYLTPLLIKYKNSLGPPAPPQPFADGGSVDDLDEIPEVPQLDSQGRLIDDREEIRSESRRMLNRLQSQSSKLPPGLKRTIAGTRTQGRESMIPGAAPARDFLAGVMGASPTVPGSEAYRTGQALANMPGIGAPAAAGIFVGKSSKLWNRTMNEAAKKMEKAGVPAEEIWQKTGNFKGPDNQWRQEISDIGATHRSQVAQGPASMVFQHPELYQSYPDMKNIFIRTNPYEVRSSYTGTGVPGAEEINLGTAGGKVANVRGLLHEMQHGIQFREGFGLGGSKATAFTDPKAFEILNTIRKRISTPVTLEEFSKQAYQTTKITPEIEDAYKNVYLKNHAANLKNGGLDRMAQEEAARTYYNRLLGETEARAVEARQSFTPEQRLKVFPTRSYKVDGKPIAVEDLIVKTPMERAHGGAVSRAT